MQNFSARAKTAVSLLFSGAPAQLLKGTVSRGTVTARLSVRFFAFKVFCTGLILTLGAEAQCVVNGDLVVAQVSANRT